MNGNGAREKNATHKTVCLQQLLATLVSSRIDGQFDEGIRADFILCNKLELIELANLNLMSFALYSGLRKKNLLQYLTPDEAAYLKDFFELNTQRNQHFLQETHGLIAELNKLDIEVVLLKGAVALVDRWYKEIGERFLRDIDLLVPKAKAQVAYDYLLSKGYELVNPLDENLHELKTHQLPALHKKDSPLVIELHIEPITLKAKGILSAEQVFAEKVLADDTHVSRMALTGGGVVRFYVPCPQHCLLIALVHTEIADANRENHRFFLRHGMDIERILNRYGLSHIISINNIFNQKSFVNLLPEYLQVLDFFFRTNFLKNAGLESSVTGSHRLSLIFDKLIEEQESSKNLSRAEAKVAYVKQLAINAFSKEKISMRYEVSNNISLNKYRVINLFRLLKKYTLATNRKNLSDSIDDSLATKNLLGKE